MSDLNLPTRNVVNVVSHGDHRMVKWFEDATKAIQSQTGWGTYTHNGATQSIVAGVQEPLENNKGILIETQKPADVVTFYDGTVITGRSGDGVAIGIELTFTPTSNGMYEFVMSIDLGGAIGELYSSQYPITKGNGVPHKLAYTAIAYQLDTWEANGGTVKVVCDGPGDITAVRYVIQRTHRAR